MRHDGHEAALRWLQSKPTLKDLCEAYPDEWAAAQHELAALFERGKPEAAQIRMAQPSEARNAAIRTLQGSRADSKRQGMAISLLIRDRMVQLTIKRHLLSAATGVANGKFRFNLFNGYLAQRLLFSKGFERKPVPLLWFRLLWPLVWQKRLLMPLVEAKGIYCFYSRPLIEALATIIGARPCLEIAAGDGTLTRFLSNAGVQITATDNHAWGHAIHYPEEVARQDARAALAARAPEVVICSWPPTNNGFEEHVFASPSVQLYIVIASRHRFAAGNWDAYQRQAAFSLEEDKRLSGLVLPPELESAVYLFRRKA